MAGAWVLGSLVEHLVALVEVVAEAWVMVELDGEQAAMVVALVALDGGMQVYMLYNHHDKGIDYGVVKLKDE